MLTGNFSFQTFSPTPGSYAIHRVAFDAECDVPHVKKLADLPDISQPNGIVAVPDSSDVLIADTRGGFLYRFDTTTRKSTVYFDDPLLKPNSTQGILFGVNGVKFSHGYLYFSNTNKQIVARVKASGKEPVLRAKPEVVVTQTSVDDFTVDDRNGDIYTAEQTGVNGVGFVSRDSYGSSPEIIAGGSNSTAILTPTAVILAKGAVGRTLLVSLVGDFMQFITGNFTGGGKIATVHLN